MSNVDHVGATQLGYRLAQLRERTGLTQEDLARKVTWSQAVLSGVEAGEHKVSDDELRLLLAAIDTVEAAELATVLDRSWRYLPRPPLDHADQGLLRRAEEMMAGLDAAGRAPGAHPAFRTRVQEYLHEVRRLAGLLLRRDHQIAFIGSIGIGKSTAICRALGLQVTHARRGTVAVLETGAGGITVCEVHLTHGPGSGIIVEPRTHDDIRADVEDFVEQLLRRGLSSDDGESTAGVPHEIERAIRNMSGLTRKSGKGLDGKTVRTDPAKELATTFPDRRDLVVEVLTRMSLDRRDRHEEWHTPAVAAAPLEWLRSTFEAINNGRHPQFSLPGRIDIVVPTLLEIDDLDIAIIDTRGIDQPLARADLEALLGDPHTVSILCSGFNDAPSQAIQHLLRRARDINNTQIDTNCGLLVLPHLGEALAVKDDETGNPVETSQDGYDLKGEQVSDALLPYRLSQIPTLFFNAIDDDPELLRTFLRTQVTHTRAEFRRRLHAVLDRTRSMLDNAAREHVQAVQRAAASHLASWIQQHPTPKPISGHVHDPLLEEISEAHAGTVNATVRRDGEWRSLSYSHQLGHGARKLAVLALHESVIEFNGLCTTLSGSMPAATELLSQAQRLMTSAYDELLRKVQLNGLNLYHSQLRHDTRFWTDNINEWGRGPGYLKRVLQRNLTWFQEPSRQDLEKQLGTFLDREWRTLIERVQAILEQS